MLPDKHRLRRREEFAAAIRAGRRASRGRLVVHVAPGAAAMAARPVPVIGDESGAGVAVEAAAVAGGEPTRIGFVIPRAVGCAVDRNRVRRRLRHLLRDRIPSLPPGLMVVVRVLPGATDASFGQLAKHLDAAVAAASAASDARGRRAR